MKSNLSKCKELTFRKKSIEVDFPVVFNIPQCMELKILGVVFQDDCKFKSHVHSKLIKANKCLYVLRSLRKEGYNQKEVDHLFNSLVLPNITYVLAVYGTSKADLSTIQFFLQENEEKGEEGYKGGNNIDGRGRYLYHGELVIIIRIRIMIRMRTTVAGIIGEGVGGGGGGKMCI